MHRRRIRNLRAGLTLIELLVVLAVVALMVLLVGKMVADAKETVGFSQALIKANAQARAAAEIVRDGLQSATKDGYLAIVIRRETHTINGKSVTKDFPYLVFSGVSTFRSKCGTFEGRNVVRTNGARVEYGLGLECDRDSGQPRGMMLFRRAILHLTNNQYLPGMWVVKDVDVFSISEHFADLHSAHRTITNRLFNNSIKTHRVYLPVTDMYDIQDDEPHVYMIGDVTDLKIEWGRATDTGRMVWYGKDDPRDAGWANKNKTSQDTSPTEDWPEFTNGGAYCALWTRRNMNNWPDAIRFELTIGDDPSRTYEMIMSIPR